MMELKKGDVLVALNTSGFPDNLKKGKKYKVSSIYSIGGKVYGFFVFNEEGLEITPVETSFKIEKCEVGK